MYEEGVIKWESVITILIGIVIISFVFLIVYRKRKAKSRRIKQESELLNKQKQARNHQTKVPLKKDRTL